jgi:pimeloyl-ACP methyl ester carboxylesterase
VGVPEGFHTGSFLAETVRSIAAAPVLLVYPGALGGRLLPYSARRGFWRSFLDGDTRAARDRLRTLEVPATIIHGAEDSVVGVKSALLHHELIPDSRLVFYDGGHGWIYNRYDELGAVILEAMGAYGEGVEP